jgi:hypothetical protein
MKFRRPLLVLPLLVIVLVAVWFWWSLPAKVDMANYAPADSMVYVEFNDPAAVVQAIQHSTLWQAAAPITQSKSPSQNRVATAAARAGIGKPTKLFLSTFGVPSARMRGRDACTLKRARRNAPQIKYINERNQASRCSGLPSVSVAP